MYLLLYMPLEWQKVRNVMQDCGNGSGDTPNSTLAGCPCFEILLHHNARRVVWWSLSFAHSLSSRLLLFDRLGVVSTCHPLPFLCPSKTHQACLLQIPSGIALGSGGPGQRTAGGAETQLHLPPRPWISWGPRLPPALVLEG